MDAQKPDDLLLQALWEGATDAMALSDQAGIVQAANPAYYRLYGYTAEEVIGHSFAIIFPPEMREWALAQYQAVFHSYTPIPAYETTIQRKDGAERLVEARTMFITAGDAHTGMLSIVRDITEQRQYDVERQRLAALVEQAPDLIGLITVYGHSIYLNRAGKRMLGINGIDAVRQLSLLQFFDPEDREVIQREVLPAVMTSGHWSGELRLLQAGGAVMPVWLEAFRIDAGQSGHMVHIATIGHPLHERHRGV